MNTQSNITEVPALISDLADMVGGNVLEVGMHPGGESGYAILSMELSKDHWLYETAANGHSLPPPFPLLAGKTSQARQYLSDTLWPALKYGVKSATANGEYDDFSPDALIRNVDTGIFGYHTDSGLTNIAEDASWCDPTLPGDLAEVLLEALKLAVGDGLISTAEIIAGLSDASVAQAQADLKARQDQRAREHDAWCEARGIARTQPGTDQPQLEDSEL